MRSDEDALALMRTKAAALRRRRGAVGGGALGLALVAILALSLGSSTDQTLEARGEGLDRSTRDPDPSSESTTTSPSGESGEGAIERPIPTTTAPPAPPLRVEAVLLDERPLIDSELHFRVTVTDGDGSPSRLSVKAGVHLDQPDPSTIIAGLNVKMDLGSFPPCGEPGPSSTTLDVAVPYRAYDYMSQAYGRTGDHWVPLSPGAPPTIAASFTAVSSTGCAGEGEETAASGPVTIRLGFGNGPERPRVNRLDPDSHVEGPRGPTGGLWAADCDGIVDRIEVDWGDGTAVEQVRAPAYGCFSWPAWRVLTPQHEYAVPGRYTIAVVAASVDDRGDLEQRSEPITIEYTAP